MPPTSHQRRRNRLPYATAAAVTFALGVGVAQIDGSSPVRGYGGDVLATFFVYMLLRALGVQRPTRAALLTVVISFAIEAAQYFRTAQRLGFGGVLLVIFGSTFDVLDLAAYAVGIVLALAFEQIIVAGKRSQSDVT